MKRKMKRKLKKTISFTSLLKKSFSIHIPINLQVTNILKNCTNKNIIMIFSFNSHLKTKNSPK